MSSAYISEYGLWYYKAKNVDLGVILKNSVFYMVVFFILFCYNIFNYGVVYLFSESWFFMILQDYFKQYLKVARGVSDRTVGHYITGLKTIDSYLERFNFPIKSVYDVKTVDDLNLIADFLQTNPDFIKQNTVGHNMYSVSFKHFYNFACEDEVFFKNNISKMDVTVKKPTVLTTTIKVWKRNQIIIDQVLEGANYYCEHNNDHQTFISKSTNKPYMEGHHLIPLKHQEAFDNSIDVYANIVCLCPVCHRLLHHGLINERTYVAEELFDQRSSRLIASGIDLSKKEFLKMAASL